MLSKKVDLDQETVPLVPTYARRGLTHPISRYQMPQEPMEPSAAYQLIHDELALDGNPELNLATFVTTWMDPEADRLMAETANKNAIDWDEYPQTVELQDRCVNMLARLFRAGERHRSVGTATVGSSEAIHLAGLAMKWRWRKAREAAGKPADRPNLVMGANVQVCWEKFARYFDVEPRFVPLTDQRFVIGVPEAMALVDENTIGVVGILGSTYTGEYEPIAELNEALDQSEWDAPIHVDAASGGFVAPFVHPTLEWDFRLSRVRSINVSGHKYGLVYPGVGWVVWRDQEDLPEELVFTVDYLGGSHANFGLNFSRGAAQIVAQYYNLIRLGWEGYRDVMTALGLTARWLATEIERIGVFDLLSRGHDLPVVCFRLRGDHPYTVFDLSDVLRQRGWIVPAYKMAPDADDVAVLRVVVREGLSADMAAELVADIRHAVDHLNAVHGAHGAQDGHGVHDGHSPAKPAGAPGGRGGRKGRPAGGKGNKVPTTRAVC
ncbi:MAG TPA: glutamate decarboxylase [Acidimicrobiales bacterium]|nr:glutamate decarboxylase [Acidimicrobiales bacterium]